MKLKENRSRIEHDSAEVLAKFKAIEGIYGYHGCENHFITLAHSNCIARSSCFSPRIYREFLLKLVFGKIPVSVKSRCRVDEVRVKNNLIGFYYDEGRIIKIFGSVEGLNRHLKGVATFMASNPSALQTSQIFNYSEEPFPHTVEAFLLGRKLAKPVFMNSFEICDLAQFHFNFPELCHFRFSEHELDVLLEVLGSVSLSQKDLKYVSSIVKSNNNYLLCGDIHGDLSCGNIFNNKDAKVIIDWESYGRDLIASDILKLWTESDQSTRVNIINVYNKYQDSCIDCASTKHVSNFQD